MIVLDGTNDWRRIVPGVPPVVSRVWIDERGAVPDRVRWEADVAHPEPARPWRVDWMLAGRIILADMIGRHVQWAQLYLGTDGTGRLRPRWLTRSLQEVMYLQLMEHVQREPRKRGLALPYWPLPQCGYCGGVVLGRNPRGPNTAFANRWHAGPCRKAGQAAKQRPEPTRPLDVASRRALVARAT
jgi:hypothetical protein